MPDNDFYRSCNDKLEEKTAQYLLSHSMALGNLRRRTIFRPEFTDRTCLKLYKPYINLSLGDAMQELQLYGKMFNIVVRMGSYEIQVSSAL